MALRAKFRCYDVISTSDVHGDKYSESVKLHAVTDETEDNKSWAKATPAGQLSMTIDNPKAFESFRQGDEYYLTIEKA